jgi:hypothetical protein
MAVTRGRFDWFFAPRRGVSPAHEQGPHGRHVERELNKAAADVIVEHAAK